MSAKSCEITSRTSHSCETAMQKVTNDIQSVIL